MLEHLHTCGAVSTERTKGAGRLIRVTNQVAFDRFVESQCPSGLDLALSDIEDRAQAVMALGDAKRALLGRAEGIFLRSTKEGARLDSADKDRVLPVNQLTSTAGGACIVLNETAPWGFRGTVAIIENQDTFWLHEQCLPDVDLAVLANGTMSERLLRWLASEGMGACNFIFWGDYDPIGVWEYCRLVRACPDRVKPFCPDSINEFLPRYGKRSLLKKKGQQAAMGRLLDALADPFVRRMVKLFQAHGKGLEQEVLLSQTAIRVQADLHDRSPALDKGDNLVSP